MPSAREADIWRNQLLSQKTGETLDQAFEAMVFGESGILAFAAPASRPHWSASRRQLTRPNGAVAQIFSGANLLRQEQVPQTQWRYSAAMQALDGAHGPLELQVAQLSESFGPGLFRKHGFTI
jgi:hypothetical protein